MANPVVIAEDAGEEDGGGEVFGSPLLDLRAKLAAVKSKLFVDLEVPRWRETGTAIYVRYGPVAHGKLQRSIEKRSKEKNPEWEVLANADTLVASCIGVYATLDDVVGEDGAPRRLSLRPEDPEGEWTRFDKELAEVLGVEDQRAVTVCRALYPTDGDLIAACAGLMEWSTQEAKRTDGGFPTP